MSMPDSRLPLNEQFCLKGYAISSGSTMSASTVRRRYCSTIKQYIINAVHRNLIKLVV